MYTHDSREGAFPTIHHEHTQTHTYTHAHIYTHIHTHTHTCILTTLKGAYPSVKKLHLSKPSTSLSVLVCIKPSTPVYPVSGSVIGLLKMACMYMYVYMHTHIHMCVCMCVCVNIYIYIYIICVYAHILYTHVYIYWAHIVHTHTYYQIRMHQSFFTRVPGFGIRYRDPLSVC
jgi:hypothetical protein